MRLFRRLVYLLRKRRNDSELTEEIAFHRELSEEQHRAAGLTAEDARFAAQRQMGNVTRSMEDARQIWIATWIESVLQDLRYAARNLIRQPGFTVPALATLALGIGLNTSLFTVFNGVALRPWPARDPARMVNLYKQWPGRRTGYGGFSVSEYRYLREHTHTLSGVIMSRSESARLDNQLEGPGANCVFASGNYFRVLGINMVLGRGFTAEEDQIDKPQLLVVLSYGLWRTRFAGDANILGRKVRIDDITFTIVGVAEEEFTGTSPHIEDLWAPLSALPVARPNDPSAKAILSDPNYCCSAMAGRLARGVSRQQAQAELTTLSSQFRSQLRTESRDAAASGTEKVLVTGTTFFAQPNKKNMALPVFALMMAAVGLVLMLACANVSNLLLARGATRQREIASRLALGAGRSRVVRQLLTESLVLSTLAGGLGLALAFVVPKVVLRAIAAEGPFFRIKPDSTVLAYSVSLAVFCALAFGLAPALRCTRVSVNDLLKQQTPFAGARLPLRSILLALQVAISLVLLLGAGLMVRGISHARATDLGFRVRDVCAITVDLPVNRYDDRRARLLTAQLMERLRRFADGGQVAVALNIPLSNNRHSMGITLPGQDSQRAFPVLVQFISPAYLDVLGMPLLAGRNFGPQDADRKNILINEAMARRYWPGQNPLGQWIISGVRRDIIGIVRDAQIVGIGPVEPMFFSPYSGGQRSAFLLGVHQSDAAAGQFAGIITHLEPRAVATVTPMSEQVERWLGPSRIASLLAGALGMLALTLACVGIFGVMAYSVEQRRREIGVRMAIGAEKAQIIGLILRGNSKPLLAGLAAGLVSSFFLSRLLHAFLYGVSQLDPVAYGGVLLLLVAAGVTATLIPAHRATRTDPVVALRYE